MGASSYSGYTEPKQRRKREAKPKSQMEIIIDRMKNVEESRRALAEAKEGLTDAKNQCMEAEEELRRSEAAVMEQIDRLDPETKRMLKGMLDKLRNNSRDDRDDR